MNDLGFIETPYRKVIGALDVADPDLIGRILRDDVEDAKDKLVLEEDTLVDAKAVKKLKKHGISEVPVAPFATHEIVYLSADKEDKFIIAQANARLDDHDQFVSNRVSARYMQTFVSVPPQRIDYMDIAPRQIVGISAALIPSLVPRCGEPRVDGIQYAEAGCAAVDAGCLRRWYRHGKPGGFDSGQVLVADIEAEVDQRTGTSRDRAQR